MNICGIVAEYNPFHNGHLHHIQEARKLTDAEYIIVIMSGNFMQRGTPALMDKYTRAKAALSCGADLVLELPSVYATGSAEYFALGSVSLLDKLGVVTHMCFGSECGDICLLSKAAQIIFREPQNYQKSLLSHIRSGKTYPAARSAALLEVSPELSSSISFLSSPNNILGVEYIKSLLRLNSPIIPITLTRSGSDYHDKRLGIHQSSATALRQALQSHIPLQELRHQMPQEAYTITEQYLQTTSPMFINDFSEILYYKLLSEKEQGFTEYLDVSQALSDRICNNLYKFDGIDAFCQLLKTKEITYSRISRCLFHILLNIKKEHLQQCIDKLNLTPYAKILGFRKDSTPLLKEIDNHTSIPLLSKLADANRILTPEAYALCQKEVLINDIYSCIRASKNKVPMINEFSTPIVII